MTGKVKFNNKEFNIHKAYTENQKNKDVLVVLIHGLTGNYLQMHHFQDHLTKNYDTLSYDISGRGDSDNQPSPSDVHQHSEDLLHILESLPYEKFTLIGYSMGGYIAMEAASRTDTIHKVVLLDGGGEADEDTADLVLPSLRRLEKAFESVEDYRETMKQSYGALGVEWSPVMDEVIEHEVEEFDGKIHHKSDYELTKQDFESFYRYPHTEIYEQVKVPVHLIICTGPIKVNTPLFSKEGYQKMLGTVRDIDSSIYNINHYEIVFNKQQEINEEIDAFLEKE